MKRVVMYAVAGCWLLLTAESQATTIYARANGDWDDPNTWSTAGVGGATCGCVPTIGDYAIIDGYQVDIDAANVSVDSVLVTTVSGANARLRTQLARTLTVLNDLVMVNNAGGRDVTLYVADAGCIINVNGDLLVDVDNGDDVFIDVDNTGQLNVTGNMMMDQDGGDDMFIRLNNNGGTAGQLNVGGNLQLDHDGGDDVTFLVDDASSLLTVGGNLTINLNTGANDVVRFNLDNGDLNVTGDIVLNRLLDTGQIDFDMDGCDIDVTNIAILSSGALFGPGAVRFYVDQDSRIDATGNFAATMTGGDDLYLRLNDNAGNDAVVEIGGNLTVTKTDGDDIHIYVQRDNSLLHVAGNMDINTTGGEQFRLYINQDGVVDIDGFFSYAHTQGQLAEVQLANGGGQNPLLDIGGSFTYINTAGGDDLDIDLNSGTMSVGGDMTLNQEGPGDDIHLWMTNDAILNVAGDFTATLGAGDDIQLDIRNTAQFNVTGDLTLDHNGASGGDDLFLRFYDTTVGTVGDDVTLDTDMGAASTDVFYLDVNDNARLTISDSIFMNAVANGKTELELNNNGLLQIGGDFIRQTAPNDFGILDCNGNSTVEYNGTKQQAFAQDAGGGTDNFYYHNVIINNTLAGAPQLIMEGLATVNNALTLTDGIIQTNAVDILVIPNNATSTQGSQASHVQGPMRKIGDDVFIFPLGRTGKYAAEGEVWARLGISAPATVTSVFEAEYFTDVAHDAGYDTTLREATIKNISLVEYWVLDRTVGADAVNVTLYWEDAARSGINNLADLRPVRYEAGTPIWRDHNPSTTTGGVGAGVAGTISTTVPVTSFSPFTFGSNNLSINPLPVELLTFEAHVNGDRVDLKWVTATEINNDFFTVERSQDGTHFEELINVDGAGNSNGIIEYMEIDPDPYSGVSYYRLKQTDMDGTVTYSHLVPVQILPNGEPGMTIFPNPNTGGPVYVSLFGFDQGKEVLLVLRDIRGREVFSKVIVTVNEKTIEAIDPVGNLPAGTYLVTGSSDNQLYSRKLVIR